MQFNVGVETLDNLVKNTQGSHATLGGLVKQFIAAAEPLEKYMDGAGKVAFDSFKLHSDEISQDLENSLLMVNQGQAGMNTALHQGDQEAADNATRLAASADFDGARFGTSR